MAGTGTNTSHRKLQKQKLQHFYAISLFIQKKQYKKVHQT